MFQETLEKSGEAELTNNIGKTVLMNNIISVRESDCAITVGGTKIERRVEGKYLGQIISFENRQEKELKERRKKSLELVLVVKASQRTICEIEDYDT